jgi:hypothetical protein
MVNTVAHEVTHDFLMSNSTVGKELIKYHTTYKLLDTGEFQPENPHKTNMMLFMMSRYVNEGFATFIGDLVLQMFAEDYKNHVFSSDSIKKEDVLSVIKILKNSVTPRSPGPLITITERWISIG